MRQEYEAFLREHAREWNLPPGETWKLMVYNNYQPNYSTVNLLWFEGANGFPCVVTKAFRGAQAPRREFASLQRIYAAAPAYVPRPLHLGELASFWALWMEGVPGFPLTGTDTHPHAVLKSLTDTVAGFHAALAAVAGGESDDRYQRTVLAPLEAIAAFQDDPSIRGHCARLRDRITTDWLATLPVVPQHGDLYFNHMLRYRGQWRIIDWETFGVIDLPLYDIVTLLFSLLRTRNEMPDRWSAGMVRHVPSLIRRYTAQIGLHETDVRLLLPLTLLNWFYIQWLDGRKEFISWMYRAIRHYFDHVELWENVFVPVSKG
jgi:hypothetical protein